METQFKICYSTTVKAPLEKVWEALTQAELVKQYFFDADLITSWQPGTPIVFRGEWEGQSYQDKGEILEYEANKRLAFSYLSNWSGKEDLPENYLWVCYEVEPEGSNTRLSIHQSNYSEEIAKHSEQNWAAVADGLKHLIEV